MELSPRRAGGQWLFAALFALCGTAHARDIPVGPAAEYQTIEAAVFGSAPGDRLLIAPGTYQARDVAVPHDLTVEGLGGVTVTSDRPVAKGLFVPQADFTVRNLTLAGARSPDRNGAGIRHEGGALTVEDASLIRNDDGILATGEADGTVAVRRSLFDANGHGDGYSHAIYAANGKSLLVEDSRFTGTRVGHHVKSLLPLTVVTRSSFDDADGRTSYVVDATGGGRLVVTRNEIVRRADADQATLVNYDASRGGAPGAVEITGNAVRTHKPRTRALRNPEGARVEMSANAWLTAEGGGYAGPLEAAAETAPPPRRRSGHREATPPVAAPPAAPPPLSEADIARLTPEQQRAVRRLAERLDRAPTRSERAPPRPKGLLRAARIDAPPGAYAAYELVGIGEGLPWLTFGAVLAPGVLADGDAAQAFVRGEALPTQVDVLARHADGSVRHAAVTVTHGLDADEDAEMVLAPRRAPAGAGFEAPATRPPLVVSVEGTGPDGAFSRSVTLGTDEDAAPWLDGPLATERTEAYALTPLLRLRADVRTYASGDRRVRLTFENHETYLPGPRDLAYAVTVARGDAVVWRSPQIRHYRHAGWTVALPEGRASHVVRHDPSALIASGAFLPFDLSVPVRAGAIGDASPSPVLPGDHASLVPYMPTTGGRPEIGPVTGWTAAWLKTQHPAARAAMIRAAEVGITAPWHFEEAGRVVTPATRPGFWADARGADGGPDGFPAEAWSEAPGGWTVDTAHKPDLAFPAYLATAEPAFARALAHEAAYAATGIWPALRGPKGDILLDLYQTRETAWSLRTIGNAAWALPDDDPLKAVFEKILIRNLTALPDYTYDAGPAKGVLPRYGDDSTVAPWQQDFLAMTLAQEALRGTPGAHAALRDMAPYLSGRVLEAGGGVRFAAASDHVVAANRRPALSWAEIVSASPPGEPYLGAADGYHSVLLAALSAAHAATGEPSLALAARELAGARGAEGLRDPANRNGLAASPQMGLDLPGR